MFAFSQVKDKFAGIRMHVYSGPRYIDFIGSGTVFVHDPDYGDEATMMRIHRMFRERNVFR